jgi:hypothetical protein
MDDAGDPVAGADLPQRGQVGDVGLLGEHPPAGLGGQVAGQDRLPALDQHARLAHVQQGPRGVRSDEAQPARHQDHPGLLLTSMLMMAPS